MIARNLYQPENGARPLSFSDTAPVWSNCLDSHSADESLSGRTLSATCASLAKKGLIETTDDRRTKAQRRGEPDESTIALTREGFAMWQAAFPFQQPVVSIVEATMKNKNTSASSSSTSTSAKGKPTVGKGNILPVGQKNALPSPVSVVSSTPSSPVNPVPTKGATMNATLKFRKTDKSGSSSYAIEGLRSSVYFNKGMFAGEPPTTLEVTLPEGFAFGEPGAKPAVGIAALTPEQRAAAAAQRKAELAAMTPAERAALKVEQARKTLEAAEKAAAKAAQSVAAKA
jgi:hypothetical protein